MKQWRFIRNMAVVRLRWGGKNLKGRKSQRVRRPGAEEDEERFGLT